MSKSQEEVLGRLLRKCAAESRKAAREHDLAAAAAAAEIADLRSRLAGMELAMTILEGCVASTSAEQEKWLQKIERI